MPAPPAPPAPQVEPDGTPQPGARERLRAWMPGPRPDRTVSTGLAERLAEREAALRRRRLVRGAIAAGALAVVGLLLWAVFFSPLFRLDLDQVEITGEGTVIEPADVMAVVRSVDETPLTRLDTVGLRLEILDVPGVRDVRVARAWPRGLTVRLESREPVAAAPVPGGVVLLDDEGVQVGRADAAPDGLPEIDIDLAGESRRSLEAALILLNALPPELSEQVRKISAETPDAVTMRLADGSRVLWGSAADAALKVQVLQVLRSDEASRKAVVFDVSAPTAPITR